ncbi:winged helix-turn-helix transcriptional regulator [Pseudonocardia sp. GCM10023141]|uniref:winged helix-turn-helix transcriptional regulator n=1 Tax=Pseudonocardia sp. GCM10023141 TaxID=3252653 RepID=UPI003620DB45
MDWLTISAQNCSIRRTLEIVGEKWTLLVIRDAMNGVRRFDDFHHHVGLSEPVLADRLRKLVAAGILERQSYRVAGQRARTEYRLTAKGWQLRPALIALMQWGDEHVADAEGPSLDLRHKGCGGKLRADVVCEHGHVGVAPQQTSAAPGPSARPVAAG